MKPDKKLFLIGILFLGLSFLGAFLDLKSTLQAYLFSFLFWSDLPIGALTLLLIFSLTGGHWAKVSQKILLSLSQAVRVFAILFLPILLGLKTLYPWMDSQIAADPAIHHKHLYLNSAAFTLRSILYFGIWIALDHGLQKKSTHLEKLGGGGLILLLFTTSFAAIDWQMSIEPQWSSTLYGMIYGLGQSLSSFALSLILLFLVPRLITHKTPTDPSPQTLLDLGNILLTLVMTWAYLSFMQYLIIWSGNLPHEVTWFQKRTQGGWGWLALLLFLFQFAAPFILLLFRSTKRRLHRLAFLGGIVFVVRLVDHYWNIMPGWNPDRFEIHWQALTTWIGIGSLCLATFTQRLYALEGPSHV